MTPYAFTSTHAMLINGVDCGLFGGPFEYPLPGCTIHDALFADGAIYVIETNAAVPNRFLLSVFIDGAHKTLTCFDGNPPDDRGAMFLHLVLCQLNEGTTALCDAVRRSIGDAPRLTVTPSKLVFGHADRFLLRYLPPGTPE
jgi:hypothetical protein